MSDKRHFHRVLFTATVELKVGGLVFSVDLKDISQHGALITQPKLFEVEPGINVQLTIPLSSTEEIIQVEAKIQHAEHGRMGLEFHSMDIDSISNLRRLLEVNLADDELLNRDLTALLEHHH